MTDHPAIAPGRAAVITGAASGIGLAAARRLAERGMKLCLADIDANGLEAARTALADCARDAKDVVTMRCDVARREEVEALRQRAEEAFGTVAVLMNNAGREGG